MTLIVKVNVSLPAGISLVSADDLETWYLDIKVLDDNPIYLNQTFRLMFRFGPQYPIGKLIAPLTRNNDMLMMEIRAPRGDLRPKARPTDTYTSSYLLKRHYLSRPSGPARLESGSEC